MIPGLAIDDDLVFGFLDFLDLVFLDLDLVLDFVLDFVLELDLDLDFELVDLVKGNGYDLVHGVGAETGNGLGLLGDQDVLHDLQLVLDGDLEQSDTNCLLVIGPNDDVVVVFKLHLGQHVVLVEVRLSLERLPCDDGDQFQGAVRDVGQQLPVRRDIQILHVVIGLNLIFFKKIDWVKNMYHRWLFG
ncbi:hypothetical protein WICPIJ_000594 [Wickerhamomyces pijperi]|uniref:Uncharacterized protein n=1 Tax=Wickerhamomyces pijperi TaxID=599730 RepID=A0A9P8QFW9_WICPI|nr:hypothetical protein WICPIJ_000594 [Wickerhamomyces pijperi]